MMTTRASRVLRVLVFSLAVSAISRGGAVGAATLPVVTAQGAIEQSLRTPTSLALGSDGSLYVADPANRGVLVMTSAGKLTRKIGVKGIPEGVAVTADGRLLVSRGESVAIYDAAGNEIGKLGTGAGQFKRAASIALDDNGIIYVTDSRDAAVQVFSKTGSYLSRFGVRGSGDGQFRFPTAIAFEKVNRQLAVVDSLNGRVQFYGLDGTYLRSIGTNGTGPLKFMHPQGVAFEYGADSIRMYVADAMVKKIQVIDPAGSGAFLSYLNDARDGQAIPSQLAFDQAAHRLYAINGLGGVSYYQITDGSVVVNSVTTSAPANAAVVTSTAQAAGAAVDVAAASSVAPFVLSTVADGGTVTGDLLDITGIAAAGVMVAVNGVPVPVTNGLFSTAVLLAAGANEITVTATDSAGKSWQEIRKIYRVAGVQDLVVATPDVLATGKAVLNLTGSINRPAFVTVNDVPVNQNQLDWSCALTLSPGLNTIEIKAIDLTGQAVSAKRTVVYTPAAPELAVTSPAEDLATASRKVTVKGKVSGGADTKLSAELNGTPVPVTVRDGQFTLVAGFLKEGAQTITVQAATAGGDVSTVSRTIVYRKAK